MSRWYRAYEGTVTDAKLGEVALVAECSRSVAIATWHCLLESAASVNDAGRFDTTARRVAVILCEAPSIIDRVFDAMAEIGMVDGQTVSAWTRRQYESDSSTERSRKHRAAKRGDDATGCNVASALQGRDATAPDTDTETEADTEVVVEDGARENSSPDVDAIDPDGTPSFARACAQSAGVAMASPRAIATAIDLTRSWLAAGAQPDEIIDCIKHGVANAPEPIHSLRYFEPAIRQAIARRHNGVEPSARRPSGKRSAWVS